MSLRQREEALFARWSAGRSSFVPDGLVDPDTFQATSPRVVFLLKEVNHTSGTPFDLRSYLHRGGRGMTWNTVVRWTWLLRDLFPADADLTRPARRRVSPADRQSTLRTLAVVNVKKAPGASRANYDQILNAVRQDRLFISRQVLLYSADIVVAGGLDGFSMVDQIPCLSEGRWVSTGRAFFYKILPNNRLLISTPHPAARLSVADMNHAMRTTILQARTELYPAPSPHPLT